MAVFDASAQRIVLRIVYDGPANAGKTTNLAQLSRFFTPLRRGELIGFGERAGRTLFFDWLHLDGGLVAGYPLRCQLVTVPGQTVLSHRRRFLLRRADAIVFVCESSPASVDLGRRMIDGLLEDGAGRLPVVVQANKQDLPGCLGVEAVAESLGLGRGISIVPARAHEGVGVRETLVLAIRAAADEAQRKVLAGGTGALAGDTETPESLLRALEAEPGLGEASTVSAVLRSLDSDPLEPEAAPPPLAVDPVDPAAVPPLPRPGMPIGHVWPAAAGREILRELSAQMSQNRSDLVGRHGISDGSGRSDSVIVQAGPWCLKTSGRRRFADADAGRGAMLQLARHKMLLGPLSPPRTVLCLQAGPQGDVWLWTITPWLTTLRAWMTQGHDAGDEAVIEGALTAFAKATLESLLLAVRSGVVLDVHPSNFGLADGRLVYLDDDVSPGRSIPSIGHTVLRRVDEYSSWPAAIDGYVGFLAGGLLAAIPRAQIADLQLGRALAEARVQTPAAEAARARLLAALGSAGD